MTEFPHYLSAVCCQDDNDGLSLWAIRLCGPLTTSSHVGGDLIQWNMAVNINDSNPQSPTATVQYASHVCYPAHIVKVNGATVYEHQPNANTTTFLFGCLTSIIGNITGQTMANPVPRQ